MAKAIFLDATNKTITEVETNGYKDTQKLVGGYIELVRLGRGVDMYVDEEGLCKEAYIDSDGVKHNMFGVTFKGAPQVYMGNAVIVGSNDEGETTDCPVSKKDIAKVFTFVEFDNPQDRPEPQMGFISF